MKGDKEELDRFIDFAGKKKGLDLTLYRSTFLRRRLMMRMSHCETETVTGYLGILKNEPQEWEDFLRALSINVSGFFRDKDVFDFFSGHCLKEIINRKENNKQKVIHFWSAGCSRGEEPYTLAVMLLESLIGKEKLLPRVLATDIDTHALDAAKEGVFKEESIKNVSPLLLRKYFTKTKRGMWLINDSVKRIITFKRHNLFDDPPFKYMDAVFCRNVRIYFNARQAQDVLWHIYGSLKRGGYFVMGKVETMPIFLKKYFVDAHRYYKIFQKK